MPAIGAGTPLWARFRHVRVSLEKWANREIKSKTEAETLFDDLKNAVRSGSFDKRGLEAPRETSMLTFRPFVEIYKGAPRIREEARAQHDDRLPLAADHRALRVIVRWRRSEPAT